MCRREGVKLFLKGEKCFTKCILEKRPSLPGAPARGKSKRKTTDYGLRLREKQKLKRMIGINEAQMRRYYSEAQRQTGSTGENMLKLLDVRLDSVMRHLGLATSPRFARQLVGHGHVFINGRRVTLPSYHVRPGDVVQVNPKMKENFFLQLSEQGFERRGSVTPGWINWNKAERKAEILRLPEKGETHFPVNDQYIVEFYTRR